MKLLTTFILVGVVDSYDAHFAKVEFNTNPASNGGPAMAVMPIRAFPCVNEEGQVFFVAKLHEDQPATIICYEEPNESR